MNYTAGEYTECPTCHRTFKTRGLGIHRSACGGSRKKPPKDWWNVKTPLDGFIAKSGLRLEREGWGVKPASMEAVSTLALNTLPLNAVYELSYDDRVALGVFSGYMICQTELKVFIELGLDSENTLAWTAMRPWQGAEEVKIYIHPD